jgi:hypothetical protein
MKCNSCEHLFNTTITMQTVGSQGLFCHNCIEKAVIIHMKIRSGDIKTTPSKMDLGY